MDFGTTTANVQKIPMNARDDVSSGVIGQNLGQATSSAYIYILTSVL